MTLVARYAPIYKGSRAAVLVVGTLIAVLAERCAIEVVPPVTLRVLLAVIALERLYLATFSDSLGSLCASSFGRRFRNKAALPRVAMITNELIEIN